MKKLLLNTVTAIPEGSEFEPFFVECFLGEEDWIEEFKEFSFVEPYDGYRDKEAMKRDALLLRSAANNYYIPRLADTLNRAYGLEFSVDFWRVALGGWLLTSLTVAWTRYRQFNLFLELKSGEHFEVELFPSDYQWKFSDTADFVKRGANNLDFHHWVLSLFIEDASQDGWVLSRRSPPVKPVLVSQIKLKWRLVDLLRKIKLNILDVRRFRCLGVYGLNFVEQLAFSALLMVKSGVESPSPRSTKISEEQLPAELPDSFVRIMDQILSKTHPDSLGCEIKNVIKKMSPTWGKKGKIRVIGPYLFYDDSRKIPLAYAYEQGERIICTQHGGYYGWLSSFMLAREIEYTHHHFFSWGWDHDDEVSGDIVPMPSPYLSKLSRCSSAKKASKLFFVGTDMNALLLRLFSIPYGTQLLKYREDKLKFFSTIPPDVLQACSYRPYIGINSRTSFADLDFIKGHYPGIDFQMGSVREFHKSLVEAKLVVVDHPITTLSLAMAIGRPLVAYWRPDLWTIHDGAKPFFRKLEEVGLLHDNPESAGHHVALIWDDIEGWWNNEDVMAARIAWCERFALTSGSWRRKWYETLKSIL